MGLTIAGANAALTGGLGDSVAYISLHDGNPGNTGAAEITGGTPAYARQAVTWGGASSGLRSNSNSLTYDVPASTILHYGLWSAVTSGTFYGYYSLSAEQPRVATFNSVDGGMLLQSCTWVVDDRIVVSPVRGLAVPTGITEGTAYYVKTISGTPTNVITLSATSGGSTVGVGGGDGRIVLQRVIPEVYAAQGILTISTGALVLDGRVI